MQCGTNIQEVSGVVPLSLASHVRGIGSGCILLQINVFRVIACPSASLSPLLCHLLPLVHQEAWSTKASVMSDWVLLGLIAVLVMLLLLTVFGFAVYSGLFTEVVVSAGSPPVGSITLAYKFRVGPYGESGQLFTDGCSISSKLCSIGVYYDNPHTERKLCAHPRIEIYKEDRIYFVCPLARQGDFYVPEMKELERKSRAAAAEAEDAQTDITGADTLSEASSISIEATTDSRDTSVATSILLPFPASRGREEADNRSEHSYSESGASGSSFEELDLEVTMDGEGAAGLLPDTGCGGKLEVTDKWTKEPIAAERGEE
ncbi:testis-expressed protein 264 isoform 3-T28 [Amazona ochrocephala]